jgi:hypothetical protein
MRTKSAPRLKGIIHKRVSQRYFEGLPVIDAKEPLRVFVNESDIKKARPQNPKQCVYAQACKRLFGARTVVFLRTTAYVDLPNEKGNRFVNRFTLHRTTGEAIQHFDKTGEAHPGGFLLSPPRPSRTLDGQRDISRKRRKEKPEEEKARVRRYMAKRKEALLKGENVITGILNDVRYGKGMVHFPPSPE